MNRVVVIGGGAAGMMAAAAAASVAGTSVVLIEHNEKLGKKLFITGKGRCNLTNACDTEEIFGQVVTNPKFLYSCIYGFDNFRVMQYMEEQGLALKTERGNRVFPQSDHSSDVIRALERDLRKKQVEIHLQTRCTGLEIAEGKVRGVFVEKQWDRNNRSRVASSKGRPNPHERIPADKVILATGGLSYPSTGSTGDGYILSKAAGHTVVKPYPALVPLVTKETWCKDLMGLSLKNVSLQMLREGKVLYEGFGEMLFTHFGVSGPLVLSASSYYHQSHPIKKGRSDITKEEMGDETILSIDLKPALSEEQLEQRLIRDFERYRNRNLSTGMQDLLPKKLVPVVITGSKLDPERKIHSLTKEDRKALITTLKGLVLHVKDTGEFKEAIITGGGISVKEINPSSMESKLVSGLYFAGEMIDVDAMTGGFNLQIAWSTGYAAGKAAAGE